MTTPTLEERVARLEAEVREIKQAAPETDAVSGKTSPDFLRRFSGLFADDPTFADVVRLGREWREADSPEMSARRPSGIEIPAYSKKVR